MAVEVSAYTDIAALLKKANGRRRARLLTVSKVLGIIQDVWVKGHQWSMTHGGSVSTAYGGPSVTTLALAARVNGKVYIGIAESPGHMPSPGRAWKCLQPWNKGDMTEKFKRWVDMPNVIEVKE